MSGTAFGLDFTLARNVRNVAESSGESFRGPTTVTFVQAKVLPAPPGRLGTWKRDRLQRGTQQLGVMGVGTCDCDAQRYATGVSHDGPFDAKLTAIGRVFAGFFPRPAVPWSWNRRATAIATRSHGDGHTVVGTSSRSVGRRGVGSIPESTDAPCWGSQTVAAVPSTDSPCAIDRRCRWRRPAGLLEAARLSDFADTSATMVLTVATFSPASVRTDQTNRSAYPPPCEEQRTSIPRSTQEVRVCSVIG